jgi:CelD/BcsL family acetyltransferase involved in cellulose biosynthesis
VTTGVLAGTDVALRTVTTREELERLAPEWDTLVRAMPRPSPFLLHAWVDEWWRHYGDDAALYVPVAFASGTLVGAAPFTRRRERGVPVLRFLGGRQSVLSDLLLAPDAPPSIARDLAGRVTAAEAAYVDAYGLPCRSRLAAALGPSLRLIERVEAPVLELTDGWDVVYRAKTSSKKRNLHRRRRRQLAELGRLEVAVAREPDELARALEEAFRLHALRWEGRPDGSGFVTAVGQRFHRAVLLRLAEHDVPRIVLLKLDGRAIAFHYYFALEGVMYVHRLAFDPALARYSPGLVNTLDTVEAAAAEGLTRVEFLGGAERYKRELADRFDPLCHGLGLARGPRGRALVAAELAAIRLRLRAKRSSALRRLYIDGLAPVRRVLSRPPDALRR